jgi:hypothetical protein
MHNNTMKPMVGVAVELDGCLVLRPPPMLEFRMHAFVVVLLACYLDISKEKSLFRMPSASNVSLRGLGADEPFPRVVTRT